MATLVWKTNEHAYTLYNIYSYKVVAVNVVGGRRACCVNVHGVETDAWVLMCLGFWVNKVWPFS